MKEAAQGDQRQDRIAPDRQHDRVGPPEDARASQLPQMAKHAEPEQEPVVSAEPIEAPAVAEPPPAEGEQPA